MELNAAEYAHKRLETLLKLITMRREDADKKRGEAWQSGHYSQVAGFDGIGTGLTMAESMIRDELKELERFAKALVVVKS